MIEQQIIYRRKKERLDKRTKSIVRAVANKEKRIRLAEFKAENDVIVAKISKNKKTTERKIEKRPGVNYFLDTFSFIPQCASDVSLKWRSHSFNKERQYIEYFTRFIYPYPVSKALLLATVIPELYYFGNDGTRYRSLDYDLIQLCRKWLCDIVTKESFYIKNKNYFTKREAHLFLNSKTAYCDVRSVLFMFFEAKCKARGISGSFCKIITRVFTIKFEGCINHIIVTSFLDLIARHKDYIINDDELADICDFFHSEITKYNESSDKSAPFSCSGRTMTSIRALANEWHGKIQRENAARDVFKSNRIKEAHWKGLAISNFLFENDDDVWTITQLCNVNALINEGRTMRHCVASYAQQCSQGVVAIFHVSGRKRDSASLSFNHATVEVRAASHSIVQIKGRYNSRIDKITERIIRRWAQSNHLKMSINLLK